MAGDFNQLPEDAVVELTGLTQIVRQPTRGDNILDKIYESPTYSAVLIVRSTVRSDHRAVRAYKDRCLATTTKITEKLTFRRRTPTQHALFLHHIACSLHVVSIYNIPHRTYKTNLTNFMLLQMLEHFHPERTITVKSRDPDYC